MQKSKLTVVVPKQPEIWKGKKLGKYILVFENSDTGTLTVYPDQRAPIVGDVLSYELKDEGFGNEVKVFEEYATPRLAPERGGGRGPDVEANINAIALTKSFIEAGKVEVEDYKAFFIECYEFMYSLKTNGQ